MGNIDYFKILAILGAVFTFIITYFDKEHKKYLNLKEKYFKNILVLYVNKYRKNKNINPVKFLKKQINENECFIPPYILFLIDDKNKIGLHKVLITDYKNNFPSSRNNIFKTISRIDKVAELISVISLIVLGSITLIIILEIILLILLGIVTLIINKNLSEFIDIIKFIVKDLGLYVIFIFIFIFIFKSKKIKKLKIYKFLKKYLMEFDEYSNDIENIKNIINSKIKVYDKNKNYEYLK